MAFLYEIIKKYGDGGGTTTTTSSRTKKGGVDNTVLLQVESRNVFCTTTVEALVAALGGRIAKYVGLPAIVALASIPFFTGAILSLCLHDSSSSSNSNSDTSSSSKLTTRHNNEKKERSDDDNNNQKQEEQQQLLTTAAAAAATKPPMFSRRIPFSARSSWFISPSKSSNNLSSSLASFIDDDDDDDDTQDATTATAKDADGQSQENNDTTTDDALSSPATSSMTTTTTTTTNNLVQKLFQQFRDNVPPRLWTLFFVGVVLNCGTYVASTSLNPLLWKLVGIPLEQFGTLYAGCGALSAVGALLAPSIRKILSPTMATSTNNNNRNGGTERLLSFMLCTSALAYGLMALSTFCHTGMRFFMAATPSSTAATTTTTATCTSIGSAVVASLLLSLVRGLAWPVLGSAINASVENNNSRATTLSMFSGSVKIGMVLTGIVLGGIFKKTTNSASSTAGTMSPLMIGKGLLQGCGVCGIVLVCTAVWLASVGLPKSSASFSSSSSTSSSAAPNSGDHATPQKAKEE